VHADKDPEPLNLGVPVVNFPRANAILARAQALLWVRDWGDFGVLVYGFDFKKNRLVGRGKHFKNTPSIFKIDVFIF
jgi:hypothetical protein